MCELALLDQVLHDLTQEERVSCRLLGEEGGELLGHLLLGEVGQHALDRRGREAAQLDPGRFGFALDHTERLGEGVATVDVRVAVGAQQQHLRRPGGPRQCPQGGHGSGIGPVEVVDDEGDGTVPRQS